MEPDKGATRPPAEVRDFYEAVGWQQAGDGVFADARLFEDLREVSRDYIHKCHLRLNRYLPPGGRYLLDVASGPIQYPEYLTYSENFAVRLCADISLTALKAARSRLGSKGFYVLADITALPFKDHSLDAAVSLHTIYHVAAATQLNAFAEIYRVLKPRGRAVIVYAWGRENLLLKLLHLPLDIWRGLKSRAAGGKGRRPAERPPELYYHAHSRGWFNANVAPRFPCRVFVWRSVSIPFLRTFIHPWLLGRQILSAIYWLEDRYPHLLGKFGKYPLIVMDKKGFRD